MIYLCIGAAFVLVNYVVGYTERNISTIQSLHPDVGRNEIISVLICINVFLWPVVVVGTIVALIFKNK